jgi:hypothetical protein
MWKNLRIALRAGGTASAMPTATTAAASANTAGAASGAAAAALDAVPDTRRVRKVEVAAERDECAFQLSHTTPSAARAHARCAT